MDRPDQIAWLEWVWRIDLCCKVYLFSPYDTYHFELEDEAQKYSEAWKVAIYPYIHIAP